MIPKSIEEVLDPKNRISECADYSELNMWMDWMNYAIQKASEELAEAKLISELADAEHDREYARQYETVEADDVTTRRMKATICPSVIEKQDAMIVAKYKYNMANALVEGTKERANCIRKIATLRANSLTSFTEKDNGNNDSNLKSFSEQPYSNNIFGNSNGFMQ